MLTKPRWISGLNTKAISILHHVPENLCRRWKREFFIMVDIRKQVRFKLLLSNPRWFAILFNRPNFYIRNIKNRLWLVNSRYVVSFFGTIFPILS